MRLRAMWRRTMIEREPSVPLDTPAVGHETREVNLRGVLLAGLGLILVVALVQIVAWRVMSAMSSADAAADRPRSALAPTQSVPPNPQLQLTPVHLAKDQDDLRLLREHERQLLQSYGRLDPQQEFARIPIDRAMKLVLERNLLPSRSPATTQK